MAGGLTGALYMNLFNLRHRGWVVAVMMPFVATLVQELLWDYLAPFAWFLDDSGATRAALSRFLVRLLPIEVVG